MKNRVIYIGIVCLSLFITQAHSATSASPNFIASVFWQYNGNKSAQYMFAGKNPDYLTSYYSQNIPFDILPRNFGLYLTENYFTTGNNASEFLIIKKTVANGSDSKQSARSNYTTQKFRLSALGIINGPMDMTNFYGDVFYYTGITGNSVNIGSRVGWFNNTSIRDVLFQARSNAIKYGGYKTRTKIFFNPYPYSKYINESAGISLAYFKAVFAKNFVQQPITVTPDNFFSTSGQLNGIAMTGSTYFGNQVMIRLHYVVPGFKIANISESAPSYLDVLKGQRTYPAEYSMLGKTLVGDNIGF